MPKTLTDINKKFSLITIEVLAIIGIMENKF